MIGNVIVSALFLLVAVGFGFALGVEHGRREQKRDDADDVRNALSIVSGAVHRMESMHAAKSDLKGE